MGRPVTINGRELNFNDAPFIEANAEYSVTVDDDGTVVVERTDLKNENAKLREAAERDADVIEVLNLSLEESQAENSKLRDLIELMLSCPMDKGDCDRCRQLNDLCEVEVLAGELGIEVDG